MRLMTFLTRRQAWLTPKEISASYRAPEGRVTPRSIRRWFQFLRKTGGFVYYPYPRANRLGLQEVLVRIRRLRDPSILGVLPFGSSFNIEVDLSGSEPLVSQGYWVPGDALKSFQEYWRTALDLGLAEEVEVFLAGNTHYYYAPFESVLRPDGRAEWRSPADTEYFAALTGRNIRGPYQVRLGEEFAASPLVIPIVVEHIWQHFSSKQVWDAIRAKGEHAFRAYARGRLGHLLERPGTALRLLQEQWTSLVNQFDRSFLQPRVFFDWFLVRNAQFVSLYLNAGSRERMLAVAEEVSKLSISTALKPGLDNDDRCHLLCFAPSDRLLPLIQTARKFHRGSTPPSISLQDLEGTMSLFQPEFCRVDWRSFDPESLTWRFAGDRYLEALKAKG